MMMIMLALSLPAIAAILLLILASFAADLTRRTKEVQGLQQEDLWSARYLKLWDSHNRLADSGGRGYCRRVNREALPLLSEDVRTMMRSSRSLVSASLFLLFYVLWAAVWLKSQVRAGRDDLRPLIGVQVLLLRARE